MAGRDLLHEARPGARHANDEYRQLRRASPVEDRCKISWVEGRDCLVDLPMQFRGIEAFAHFGPRIPVYTVGLFVCEECLLEPIRIIEHLAHGKTRRCAL